jgi:cytochrome c-type biogenesis protein CcmH
VLWVLFACLTAIVLFVLFRPLVAAKGSDAEREAFNAAVYRDQLGEVESDRERGLIAEPEAESARAEIGRRLLATDGAGASPRRGEAHAPTRAVMIAVAAALPALALGLYLTYGSPRLPDQPLAARLQDPASDQNLEALVARVEARLREHPEEGEGWEVVAPIYMAWRHYTDAAEAYGHAVRLLGESPKRLSGYGQALVLANDGVVSEDARRALERAVALDPNLVEPRILLAIAKEQDGKFAEAIEDWRGLLDKSEGDVPWRKMVEKRVAIDEAHLTGKPVAGIEEPATTGAGPQGQDAPSASDIAAAQSMSPAERQAMIAQMVQGLAARLNREDNDLVGWLQLVRAYSVLDRKDDAVKALAKAKVQFSGDAQALQQLDALAAELGLKS